MGHVLHVGLLRRPRSLLHDQEGEATVVPLSVVAEALLKV